jgi:2-polyprenyl-6-methoxyphenol hydroxylase-like FAD-dependent oxidoreductase
MSNNKTYIVAVVGSGFSGTLVAAHLLSTPTNQPLRIVLAERNPCRPFKGVNPACGRLSDQPNDYLEWSQSNSA